MSQKKLGIGNVEINKKFKDREETYKYARRLKEYIRYICKKNADKGWFAQAIIVSSNIMKDVSRLRYVYNGKRGRPKKELYINEIMAENWYKGNYETDWHIHILLVSKPSYAFRNAIKEYIDKNWIEVPNAYEVEPFDLSKLKGKKVYKKSCNINKADYLIKQSADRLFCNYNFSNEEKLIYNLKMYFNESLKRDSAMRKHYAKLAKKPMSEEKQLKELERIESKFKEIEKYYYDITKEQDDKEAKEYMKKIKFGKISGNYNKVQNISRRKKDDNSIFNSDIKGYW